LLTGIITSGAEEYPLLVEERSMLLHLMMSRMLAWPLPKRAVQNKVVESETLTS
jgi:hypothetical protein